MKFLTYLNDGKGIAGVLNRDETAVIKLKDLLKKSGIEMEMDIAGLIEYGNEEFLKALEEIRDRFEYDEIGIENLKLCAPIPYPIRNLICLGTNYADHVREARKAYPDANFETPKEPIYFSKAVWPATGDGDIIPSNEGLVTKLDYEVELAIIIGKEGKDISRDKAEEYIFGYTVANDVSARRLQMDKRQWFKGKSLDGFSPMGPWIVTRDEMLFPIKLDMKAWVNDELRQDSNTNQMIFDIADIIEDLSKGMTLRRGDIILTGTPAGVGMGFNPPKYLKSGDTVKCWIDKIGTIENKVE
ncbi:MAG: fumarylacetoacetate hydrolase family protein [Peptostreptococcaceae bacterium]|nr:fumarylacetoacetate hydrolase family protein [Peptostreptococcaceae bacterium]